MKRFKVTIGEDFDVQAFNLNDVGEVAELSAISAKKTREKVQERLTYLMLGGIALALVIATAIGAIDGSFNEVVSVWVAVAVPLGYVLKAYFETPMPP